MRKHVLAGALAAAVAASGAGLALLPGAAQAATVSGHRAAAVSYAFTTLDDQADPTFNQLLGINAHNVISGYFGSGAAGHPNQGYLLTPPYSQASYTSENFPGSTQTQVTGLNDLGDTTGFWVTKGGTSHGFVAWNGVYTSYTNPHTPKMKDAVNQLLGINNAGTAVGFYTDRHGNAHAYALHQATGTFTPIHVPGVSVTATAINKAGDIVGFATDSAGTTSSWLKTGTTTTAFQYPGGTDTQAFGISNHNQIVGSYLDSAGVLHGFVLTSPRGPHSHWQTIDDPHGIGSTVINGINTAGDLVGFYTDAAGNTDGMLAIP
jgi:hypothetical protein